MVPVRSDGRAPEQVRPIKITRKYTKFAPGSVLYESGETRVLVTVSIDEEVPAHLRDSGKGWITAEYSMLPGSTAQRKSRDRAGKVDGRSVEIQRLIGRALRAVVDTELLGERTLWVDCDVLQADGGTRTAAISAAYVALADCTNFMLRERRIVRSPLRSAVAAVSVGLVKGVPLADLTYVEDALAEVDMNVVMTGAGEFVEVQGTAEGRTFARERLNAMLDLAGQGIGQILEMQKAALAAP
ncbi:MAG: ribonuclease PH [Planctomycetes bacterium]|nr:ribonuclease PH [Planctomycetota bacterium]